MRKRMRRVISILAAGCIVAAGCAAEQTEPEPQAPEPLILNTVESQDDIVLTVMRGEETILQYEGNIELWKGDDGKAYGIIYMDGEEVTQ